MSAYSRKNLKDVEDGAVDFGVSPDMEIRFARKHLDSSELGVSFFRYAPGVRSPMAHHHREQEEAYVVVGGAGRLKVDDEILDLSLWDVVRVAPETVRAFEGGPDGMELIAIGGHKPEGGDGVPVPDFWVDQE